MMNALQFIKETDWEDVFEGWRQREASDPDWQYCATKIKGWPNWESWRRFMGERIGAETRKWTLWRILKPNDTVPQFFVGPTQSWQAHFPEDMPEKERTFSKLLEVSDHFNSHSKVESMIRSFPFSAHLIGGRWPDGHITCLEGHHRVTAIALAKKRGVPISFKEPLIIALTEFSAQEKALLKDALIRGSHY